MSNNAKNNMFIHLKHKLFFFLLTIPLIAFSQLSNDSTLKFVDYTSPEQYVVAGIKVSGVEFLDQNILANFSGIQIGQTIDIPGEKIQDAIKKYWEQGLFSDVKITYSQISKDTINLNIYLKELPRLQKLTIRGLKKSEVKDIEEKLNLKQGSQITDNVINRVEKTIKDHYTEKGFYNIQVDIMKKSEPNEPNKVNLTIIVNKNEKVKIEEVVIFGNQAFSDNRLERTLKKTKEKALRNIFSSAKFKKDEYINDKDNLIAFYNENGYRDARIVSDSVVQSSEDRLKVYITVNEGDKYYFGDIKWVGNTKYPTELLDQSFGIKKGDVFDQTLLEKRLFMDEDAVSSIYLNNGYLFSNIEPVEVSIENDSINFEMRIYEGKQARIDNVIIRGNTKTNEHVIRRELRTKPGKLFSKDDIMRSIRELAQLGHFDPEKIEPNPIPNPSEGTVDLEYNLVEKSSDQLEISGGYGGGMFVGTLGLRFSNFSASNIFNGKAWRPIPTGDGQTLSLRAQSNGSYYKAYNMTFVEPWFGGKKPNSFSVSLYHTVRNNSTRIDVKGDKWLKISGASVGLGQRLKWPDDYFTIYNELSYQHYLLKDWTGYFLYDNGMSNNVSYKIKFGRNSVDQPIYPRRGSSTYLSLQITPPYSLVNNKDYTQMTDKEKYKWIEYHKWKFNSNWYLRIVQNLVMRTRAEFGYLAHYNDKIGPSPFEGFDVGGSGIMGYNLYGRETIAMRGYEDGSLTPEINGSKSGNIYNKYTLELRYPFLLKTQATIYGLAFLEGGNCWYDFKSFDPFEIKKAAGFGVRAFLPMFGMLGVDFGYGFNPLIEGGQESGWQTHFIIGQEF